MSSGFRATTARFMVAVLAAAASIPTLAFATGAVVRAGVDCGVGDPPYYDIRVTSKNVFLTNEMRYLTLAPGGYGERTISHTGQFKASITLIGGTKGSGSVIFAQAEVSLGIQLMAEGSWTDTESFTTGITNNSNGIRQYVFFRGTRTAKGTWARWYCSLGVYKQSGYGNWQSWELHGQYDGVLNCDSDAAVKANPDMGVWSPEYVAVSSC